MRPMSRVLPWFSFAMSSAFLVAAAGCRSGSDTGSGGAGGTSGSTTSSKASSTAAHGSTTGSTSTGTSGSTSTASSTSSGMLMCGPGQNPPCTCPGMLYPPKTGTTQTVYCPFSAVGMGMNIYCNNASDAAPQKCCETPSGSSPSTCEPVGNACPVTGSTPWECADPGDCGTGQQCCGTGTFNANPDFPTCDNFASGFMGTHCAASCGPTEITMCTSDDECVAAGAGTHCATMSPKANHVGACTN